ncbi:Si-specific NAD(P)(+) transhydrogenase [Aestuariibacter halophilus]|uniref:Soluble pyridine nucleotide transhydrogenase n=1 Tax=Fluctibacter halophilus TaxID=226011 RepID=A0ABS8GCN0_9ALTE|nr:Si-specific NAD(P)(+) transhydrogenase [Aestuariibacter halophilus]MCC2618248.1 Si-specific NAD(P)(+) transhydrogenase [Aestuariibacter halophilus]
MSSKKNPKHSPSAKNPPYQYDAVVIGTGPGGEGVAMQLSKAGKKVAVVERHESVGGGCTHWGTIPSKALRHSVSRLIEYNSNPLFNDTYQTHSLTFKQILKHASGVIRKQANLRGSFYERNRVTTINAEASFIDANTLRLKHPDGSEDTITTEKVAIATGSRPYTPDDIDFTHPRIYNSDTILSLNHEPKTVIVYGAGVIGCEYASIFRGMGIKVDLVNMRDRLLSFLDAEVSDSLSYHFWNNGVVIRNTESYASVEGREDCVILNLESGKRMRADCLLFANGRTGNTDMLNLDAIGLKADSRGQLKVNHNYQTSVPNVYAVGDVIGYPSLASAAYNQGRFAAEAMLQGECHDSLVEDIPTGIYTIPEISSVGKTEQELTQMKVPYEVGRAQFKHLARAQIARTLVGHLKILFHRETKQILGIHCFGERASEIVHIGQAIMQQKGDANTIDYFVNNTFNYPTMAEAYRVAALNGLNRIFE